MGIIDFDKVTLYLGDSSVKCDLSRKENILCVSKAVGIKEQAFRAALIISMSGK